MIIIVLTCTEKQVKIDLGDLRFTFTGGTARVEALPKDYQYVFKKIQGHMWMFAAGAGYDMMKIHYGLIELFEAGAAEGKHVLEITGEDVAAFCEELLRSAATYTENWREALNRDILKKVIKRDYHNP